MLVIEVDGPIHRGRAEYDDFRTDVLGTIGVTVYRILNEEIENDLNTVAFRLKEFFGNLMKAKDRDRLQRITTN